jgi:hypothetical protein
MSGATEFTIGSKVACSDGVCGELTRVVVTHVPLDEGQLWGKERVAVPIGTVNDVDNGVRLKVTKAQVRDLPPVDPEDPE